MTKEHALADDQEPEASQVDDWVPDPLVAEEFKITLMTLWRWSEDKALDFPVAIPIRGKNYRSRKMIEAFKRRMLKRAIAAARSKRQRGAQASTEAA
jgi:hypothetical protein